MTDATSGAPQGDENDPTETASDAYADSLREVMTGVINALPDHATLGELVAAAKTNPAMKSVLEIFTVQELINAAKLRPKPAPAQSEAKKPKETQYDEDGNPMMDVDAGPAVIRRRAEVPDGDLRVLKALADRGALKEVELANAANVTGDQLRILLRSLKTKGHVHAEGSGTKRRLKITRHGSGFLRKNS